MNIIVKLLEKIEDECKKVLKMDSKDWDNETLYERIYEIYEKIIKDWWKINSSYIMFYQLN